MELKLTDFQYELPDDRIAKHPLDERDQSKLLVYEKNLIKHHHFLELPKLLPKGSSLFFNNTKVIPARINFIKSTGASIEIFLLSPVEPSTLHEVALAAIATSTWECMIGNAKRWKVGTIVRHASTSLEAERLSNNVVRFTWSNGLSFADIIKEAGKVPLPPYLKRESTTEDSQRYQTVYSLKEGAVAAPTAGLHFTPRVLSDIRKNGFPTDFLTLHVSAGTFRPIQEENAVNHQMHNEQIIITKQNVLNILEADKVIAVGTTAMRTLESLYWYGAKLLSGQNGFIIEQDAPEKYQKVSPRHAIEEVLKTFENAETPIVGETSIYIFPSYDFQICKGLITNFHQPGSTLILLIAAFVGKDWRSIYEEALEKQYRFLSYGDSSLLLI
ncbi:MAG: S-adenosylmethionine:tRNA ribosyltransferase-isomerase [Bacteroidota bacterium]